MIENDWRLFKTPSIGGYSSTRYYAIARVGKKYKSIQEIKGFEKHMEREMKVPNADPNFKNYVLIGSSNIYQDVTDYLSDVNIRKNNVIARELLLTASPAFFNCPQSQVDSWVEQNMKFIQEKFGDNCIYACLHYDERTPHIHALIVPKFNDKKRGCYLSNSYYFDGKIKMRAFQDDYYMAMSNRFKSMKRGIPYSKAQHQEIQRFYSLITQPLAEDNKEQLMAKAKENILLHQEIEKLEKTLEAYKNKNKELEKECTNMAQIKQENKFLSKVIDYITLTYKVPYRRLEEIRSYLRDGNGRSK